MVGEPMPEAARAVRIRVGVVPQLDDLDADFTVDETCVCTPVLRPFRRTCWRADPKAPRLRRTRRERRAEPTHAFQRHEPKAHARACTDQRSGPADPRRADDRPRSAGAPPDLGRAAATAVAGQDDPAHDAFHGRGRAARDAARSDRPRQPDRKRYASRADRRARRAGGDRGVRRRGEDVGPKRTVAASPSASSWPARPRSATRTIPSRCSTIFRSARACAICTAPRISRTCSSS